MNDLEKMFRDGLEDFEETPSGTLWWRISSSLFFRKYLGKAVLGLALLSVLGIYSVQYFSKTDGISGSKINHSMADSKSVLSTENQTNTSDINSENLSQSIENSKENFTTRPASKDVVENPTVTAISNQQKVQKSDGKSLATAVKIPSETLVKISSQTTDAESKVNQPLLKITSNQSAVTPEIILIKQTAESPAISSSEEVENHQPSQIENVLTFQSPINHTIPIVFESSKPGLTITKYRPKKFAQFVEIYAAPNFNQTILQASSGDYNDYINYRYNSENQKITPNIGFNYRYVSKSWFINTGASYYQIRTDADYLLPIKVVDSIQSFYQVIRMNYSYQIVDYIVDPNNSGVLIPVYSSISNPDTSKYSEYVFDTTQTLKNLHYTQKYTYFEIPLVLGKEYYYKNWVFETSMGISYSRLVKSETKLPQLTTKSLMTDAETEEILVLNNFNGILGFGAAYMFSENKAVFIRPEFRYNINSMFHNSFPVSQRNNQLRIVMGIRYEL